MNVRYFAIARQIAQKTDEKLELEWGSSVGTLGQEIVKLHPGLGPIMNSVRFSVNHEVVQPETLVHEDDEVGVLPPVAGG